VKRVILPSFLFLLCFLLFSFNSNAMEEGKNYFVYEGTGDDYIRIEKPDDLGIMRIEGNSQGRHFSVLGYYDDGSRGNLFVNTTEAYEGIVPLDFRDNENTEFLEIKAVGSWMIEILPLGAARHWLDVPGTISGNGDDIVIVEPEAEPFRATISGNEKGRHFSVQGWGNRRELLVNTTEKYQGTVRIDPSTIVLQITAVGNWTVEIE